MSREQQVCTSECLLLSIRTLNEPRAQHPFRKQETLNTFWHYVSLHWAVMLEGRALSRALQIYLDEFLLQSPRMCLESFPVILQLCKKWDALTSDLVPQKSLYANLTQASQSILSKYYFGIVAVFCSAFSASPDGSQMLDGLESILYPSDADLWLGLCNRLECLSHENPGTQAAGDALNDAAVAKGSLEMLVKYLWGLQSDTEYLLQPMETARIVDSTADYLRASSALAYLLASSAYWESCSQSHVPILEADHIVDPPPSDAATATSCPTYWPSLSFEAALDRAPEYTWPLFSSLGAGAASGAKLQPASTRTLTHWTWSVLLGRIWSSVCSHAAVVDVERDPEFTRLLEQSQKLYLAVLALAEFAAAGLSQSFFSLLSATQLVMSCTRGPRETNSDFDANARAPEGLIAEMSLSEHVKERLVAVDDLAEVDRALVYTVPDSLRWIDVAPPLAVYAATCLRTGRKTPVKFVERVLQDLYLGVQPKAPTRKRRRHAIDVSDNDDDATGAQSRPGNKRSSALG